MTIQDHATIDLLLARSITTEEDEGATQNRASVDDGSEDDKSQ